MYSDGTDMTNQPGVKRKGGDVEGEREKFRKGTKGEKVSGMSPSSIARAPSNQQALLLLYTVRASGFSIAHPKRGTGATLPGPTGKVPAD